MRRLCSFLACAVSALLILAVSAPAAQDKDDKTDPEDIVGSWSIVEAPGYRGSVEIGRLRDLYLVQWAVVYDTRDDEGKLVTVKVSGTSGVGVRRGDTLAVAWRTDDSLGCTIFVIQADRLVGTSVMNKAAIASREVLRRRK